MKLAGKMASKPLVLPARHFVNGSLLAANAASLTGFLIMAPSAPLVAAGYLGVNTVLSFIKGYTLTAAVGGADMRESLIQGEGHRIWTDIILLSNSCGYYGVECIFGFRTSCGRCDLVPLPFYPGSSTDRLNVYRLHA